MSSKTCCVCGNLCKNWGDNWDQHFCAFCGGLEYGYEKWEGEATYSLKFKMLDLLKKDKIPQNPYNNNHCLNVNIKFNIQNQYSWKEQAKNYNNKLLAEKIIKKYNRVAYPFGGYVRDEIAGEHFNDLDLYFPVFTDGKYSPCSIALESFDQIKIERVFLEKEDYKEKPNASYYKKETYYAFDEDTNASIYIDCIQSCHNDPDLDHGYFKTDVYLNKVARREYQYFCPVKGYDIDIIVSDIKNKNLNEGYQSDIQLVSSKRITKLIDKGYVTNRNEHPADVQILSLQLNDDVKFYKTNINDIHIGKVIKILYDNLRPTGVACLVDDSSSIFFSHQRAKIVNGKSAIYPELNESLAQFEELGVSVEGKIVWLTNFDEKNYTRITEILRKADPVKKEEKIEINSLNPGDKVNLVITDGANVATVQATFVKKRVTPGETGVFALDKPYSSGDYNSSEWKGDNKNEAIKLGINVAENTQWEVGIEQDEETVVTKTGKKENKKTMSKEEDGLSGFAGFKALAAADAKKGLIRTGADTGIKGLRAGFKKIFAKQGMDSDKAVAVMEFLESPLGEAFLRLGLGYGLNYLPIAKIQENEYAQSLSEELRVSGMHTGMNMGMEMATTFLLPAVMEAFQNSPIAAELGLETDVPKARVSAPVAPKAEEEDEEEEEEAKTPAKMKA